MIQPVAHVTAPANILFNRYLNQIDSVPLGYNRYGFYRVDASVTRQAIIEELREIGFQIQIEFIEGIEGLTGAVLANLNLVETSSSDELRLYTYIYFNTNNHIIIYLSSSTDCKDRLDHTWESILEKFPVVDEETEIDEPSKETDS